MQSVLRIIGLIITLNILNASAEVVLDGSLGRFERLNGPNFDIRAELGQTVGNNLFHSFQTFNIHTGETATFSGPNHITNVLSRVTGGSPSTIDGWLRSTMPQANMYFINPAGIIFGEQARLDVQGAMHFSTADEIYLGNDGLFSATVPQNTLLTIAPPSAFGFLSNSPANITLQGGQLSVSEGQTLSLMGGDINLHANSLLQAAAGRINLASVASPGKVIPTDEGLELENFTQRGILTAESTTFEVSGQGAGSIYIQAGQFFLNDSQMLGKTNGPQTGGITDIAVVDLTLDNSYISNSTEGTGKGGNIVINAEGTVTLFGFSYGLFSNTISNDVNAGNAGTISITAKNLFLSENVRINSSTFGTGQGGAINLEVANRIRLSNALISASSEPKDEIDAGNAGVISIQANHLNLDDNSEISSITYGTGNSGDIVINVNQLNLSTARILANSEAYYFDDETGEQYSVDNAGDAGTISIQANDLTLTKGSQITSSTFGSGQSGTISITATDTISLEDYLIDEEDVIFSTGINVATLGSGNANAIELTTKHLRIKEGAGIGSVTWFDVGQGGEITINATGSIQIAGAVSEVLSEVQEAERARGITSASQAGSVGNAGQITINTPLLILTDDGEISTSSEFSNAGQIELNVGQLQSSNNAAIVSESQGEGDAGNIRIIATESIGLNNAKISTEAAVAAGGNIVINVPNLLDMQDGALTTSVQGGTGGGGDITIDIPAFVILDNAKIIAQAYQGSGGNILIQAKQFIASPDSLVSASSQLGLDGNVEIDSPDENVNEGMLGLSASHLDASNLLNPPCEAMSYEDYINRSRFVVVPLAGSSPSPSDLQPSRLSPTAAQKLIKTSRAGSRTDSKEDKPRQLLALLTTCQPLQSETEKTVMPEQLF